LSFVIWLEGLPLLLLQKIIPTTGGAAKTMMIIGKNGPALNNVTLVKLRLKEDVNVFLKIYALAQD
jgi:hypothetical protein